MKEIMSRQLIIISELITICTSHLKFIFDPKPWNF